MVVLLVLCTLAGTCFYRAFALSEADDETVALGIYDQDYSGCEDNYEARVSAPRLKACAENFPQALVRDYRRVPGELELTGKSRLYIIDENAEEASDDEIAVPVDAELLNTVQLMAEEFASYGVPSSGKLEIVSGKAEDAAAGDIVIKIADKTAFAEAMSKHLDDIYPDEAYELDAEEMVNLTACSPDGVYYGLLSLMEIAAGKKPSGGKVILDRFRISDSPALKERTIFIDCARKYYNAEWLKTFIRRASIQRYNTIVLHFSEAECIRIDSEAFPWLTANVKSLTRDEVRDVVKYANRYHMNVIPSFDTPGHNMFMVREYAQYAKHHPDFSFTYDGKVYDRKTRGFGSIANHYERDGVTRKVTDIGIDISKEHAVAFSNAVIDDYASFFKELGCTEFDICGDEIMGWSNFMLGDNQVSYDDRWLFLEHWQQYARKELGIRKGSPSDAFINYINALATRLEGMGYKCRVFNDEIDINKNQHLQLKDSIGITCWDLANNSAEHFAGKGHTVYNGVMQWTYYVIRTINGKDIMNGRYKTVNARNIFENWDPRSFSASPGRCNTVDEDKFGGGYFFIWSDYPDYKSVTTVMKETELRTWANSCRMWNPEVNSKQSGIRNPMLYRYMQTFAESMRQQ